MTPTHQLDEFELDDVQDVRDALYAYTELPSPDTASAASTLYARMPQHIIDYLGSSQYDLYCRAVCFIATQGDNK